MTDDPQLRGQALRNAETKARFDSHRKQIDAQARELAGQAAELDALRARLAGLLESPAPGHGDGPPPITATPPSGWHAAAQAREQEEARRAEHIILDPPRTPASRVALWPLRDGQVLMDNSGAFREQRSTTNPAVDPLGAEK